MCFISNLSVFLQLLVDFATVEFLLVLRKELHYQSDANMKEKAKAVDVHAGKDFCVQHECVAPPLFYLDEHELSALTAFVTTRSLYLLTLVLLMTSSVRQWPKSRWNTWLPACPLPLYSLMEGGTGV